MTRLLGALRHRTLTLGVPPLALGHQWAQFVVDEGQQLLGGIRLDSRQDAGDVGHRFSLSCSLACMIWRARGARIQGRGPTPLLGSSGRNGERLVESQPPGRRRPLPFQSGSCARCLELAGRGVSSLGQEQQPEGCDGVASVAQGQWCACAGMAASGGFGPASASTVCCEAGPCTRGETTRRWSSFGEQHGRSG
jgi:hypothetical protein